MDKSKNKKGRGGGVITECKSRQRRVLKGSRLETVLTFGNDLILDKYGLKFRLVWKS